MTRRLLLILALSIASTPALRADTGSSYSRYGIGDIRYAIAGRGIGLAGTESALLSPLSFDELNPASWSRLTRVRFAAGALYEGASSDDGSGSRYLSRINFDGFFLTLPVSDARGVVLGMGMTPLSTVNYDISTPDSRAGLTYTLKYKGTGGISMGHVGASVRLGNDLSLGASFRYYFGTLNHAVLQQFPSTDFSNGEVTRSARLSGPGMSAGVVFTGLRDLFGLGSARSLTLAASMSTTSYLSTTTERIGTYPTTGTATAADTTNYPEGKTKIPFSVTAGLAYGAERMAVSGEFTFQKWDDFTVDGVHPAEIRNSLRFSAGVELLPSRDMGPGWFQRLTYRFGAYREASYYAINGQGIDEWGLSAGVGIPVFLETKLLLGADVGSRGTTALNLQQDKIFRVSMTLIITEPWFIRPPEE